MGFVDSEVKTNAAKQRELPSLLFWKPWAKIVKYFYF